jgi:hypothetical protein
MKVLEELWFETGKEAYELEQRLHDELSEFRYSGEPILGSGNTELYTKDVLELDG